MLRLLIVSFALVILAVSCAQPTVVRRLTPAKSYELGAQLEGPLGSRDQWLVSNRVYHIPIVWGEVESSPGIYIFQQHTYDTISRLNNKLGIGNYQLIIGVKVSPSFYSSDPNYGMSPPKLEHAINFAEFVEQVILTFAPWGIEIWNEPEFPKEIALTPYYGGYGTDNGALYGQTVRVIYDYVKERDLKTKIIAGASLGLLSERITLAFLADAVAAGMKSDYWSFHAYVWYKETPDLSEWNKIFQLANTAHSVYPVPQILSETSVMLNAPAPNNPAHREQQAQFLRYLLGNYQRTQVDTLLWYTLANNGWRNTDLVFADIPYPAYDVWKDYEPSNYEIFLPIVFKP